MALNFPDSPSNGDTAHGFTYNSSKGVWNSASVADTAVTVYANLAAFPSSGNTAGDYAFATNTKALYVWDGAEWDRVSTGNNETPRLTTTPASTLALEADGSTSQLVLAAEDPEGFPITYSSDTNPASPNQITNLTNSGGTFTFTPSTNTAHEGSFTARLKASDGISTTSHAVTVSLTFSPATAFNTLYIAHTSGTIRTVTGGTNEGNAVSLDTMITSTAQNGDVILLAPPSGSQYGHFKITHSTGDDSYAANPFANKQIAIVGGGIKPNYTFIWHDHDGTTGVRDHPIFQRSWTGTAPSNDTQRALTYRQYMFNLTYHRHQTSTTNYTNSLNRSPMGGGTMLNCIVDLNNGGYSWKYDNSNQTTYRVSYKHCSFVNAGVVASPYAGSSTAVRVIDCAFDHSTRITDVTSLGTNGESINMDGWKYDNYTTKNIEITSAIANGTYGHLKDISSLTATNTLFNTYQSAN
tara:strand:+ start:2840 stop:4240 length:1401 start_codon:yes stop_codon:yes gene_type:complete